MIPKSEERSARIRGYMDIMKSITASVDERTKRKLGNFEPLLAACDDAAAPLPEVYASWMEEFEEIQKQLNFHRDVIDEANAKMRILYGRQLDILAKVTQMKASFEGDNK